MVDPREPVFVAEIIRGSQNIDRMKQEIKQVVNLFCGLIDSRKFKVNHRYEPIPVNFVGDECIWFVYPTFIHSLKNDITVECRINNDGCEGVPIFSNKVDGIRLDRVKRIHLALSVFVDGMLTTFPDLKNAIRPVLNAS